MNKGKDFVPIQPSLLLPVESVEVSVLQPSSGDVDHENMEREAETVVLDDLSSVHQSDLINHTVDAIEIEPSHPQTLSQSLLLDITPEINSLSKVEGSESVKYEGGHTPLQVMPQESSVESDDETEKKA